MIRAFRADGSVVLLGHELGRGGEATVLAVEGALGQVAKVYHTSTVERVLKLRAMIASPPSDPTAAQNHISICWPTELIFDRPGVCLGFLMPRVDFTTNEPVFKLYNPKDRWRARPGFTWRYLLRTAVNIASAMEAVHAKGYVVGDLNESNLMVTETALVTLVDCDSMQVPRPDRPGFFRCPVGKPDYTPPELQGRDFGLVDRNPPHDNFGLAILIFLLLMEGIHPFAGVAQGIEMSLEERIRRGESPYAGSRLILPMPVAPSLYILPGELRALFLRCFQDGHAHPSARPSAREWRLALTSAEQDLTVCRQNEQHVYSKDCVPPQCPWCQRTALFGGIDSFPQPGHQMALPAPPSRQPSSQRVSQPRTPSASRPAPPPPSPVRAPVSRRRIRPMIGAAILGVVLFGAAGMLLWIRGGRKDQSAAVASSGGGCGIADSNIDEFVRFKQGAFTNGEWTYQAEYTMPAACRSGSLVVDGVWAANYQQAMDKGKPVAVKLQLRAGRRVKVAVFSGVEATGDSLAARFIDVPPAARAEGARAPDCSLSAANFDDHVRLIEDGLIKDSWLYRVQFSMPPDCPSGSLTVGGRAVAEYSRRNGRAQAAAKPIGLEAGTRFKVEVLSASGNVLASKDILTRPLPVIPPKPKEEPAHRAGGEVVAPRIASLPTAELPAPRIAPPSVEQAFSVVHEHGWKLIGRIIPGCSGRLVLSGAALQFESSEHGRKFSRGDIKVAGKAGPGFIAADGERWKFHAKEKER
ncbi:MAG: hypothetical protein ABIZ80_02380, partial [Bryobacteraceae bacterium]